MLGSIFLITIIIIFLVDCPILKPWFGFRKPKGHKGKWFE